MVKACLKKSPMVTWVKISKSDTLGLVAETDMCMLCSQPSDLGKKYRFVQNVRSNFQSEEENNWKQCTNQGINHLFSCPQSPIIKNKLYFFLILSFSKININHLTAISEHARIISLRIHFLNC